MKQPFLLRINASKAAVFILWMIMERLTASAFAAELGSKEVKKPLGAAYATVINMAASTFCTSDEA